jgi:RHS repeat-associated protein
MSNKSGTDIIEKPQGGGALKGIGEKFAPDLQTGTGNFTIPIEIPQGRRGFQPSLSLQYSSGNGNSQFGLGWSVSIPRISRKTDKGLPEYIDDKDVFVLSGSEDLIAIYTDGEVTRYMPRTESSFAVIEHIKSASGMANYWRIKSKDGSISIYGSESDINANSQAVIRNPANIQQIFSWLLTETKDPFGNTIKYIYERDAVQVEGSHQWDQQYLSEIHYVDYGDPASPDYLFAVKFNYEERPDKFAHYGSRFEIRTVKRCSSISIEVNENGSSSTIKVYHLDYLDQVLPADQLLHNKVSLLHRVTVEGRRSGEAPEYLPPLKFAYGSFRPENRAFTPLSGAYPRASLGDPGFELADLHGNGLPDILNIQDGTVRYWRNKGNGNFAEQQQIENVPAGLTLADSGVQLIDADGDSRIDVLVTQPGISGYYPLTHDASFDIRSFQKYDHAPSINLEDPEVKLVDLTGDGVTDAIRSSTSFECYFNDSQKGWLQTRRVERKRIEDFPDVNFSDDRVKWGDVSGDGLTDILLVHNGRVDYWPSLGRGDFASRKTMENSPRFPVGYDPKRILVGDVDGDGAADIVYVDSEKIYLWINQSGLRWSDPIEISGTPFVSNIDAIRLVDLLGTGVAGVLWSGYANSSTADSMYFLDFTGGHKPYLLEKIDNAMGAITNIAYSPSTQFYLADVTNELDWKTSLPFPVQVVSRVETIDAISGGKLVSKYTYHHGHWDGAEREYRGFASVDKCDTETFDDYHGYGAASEGYFSAVGESYFSASVETRTWFHIGPVGPEYGAWQELDLHNEYWPGDPSSLSREHQTEVLLMDIPRRDARDVIRSLRGKIIRSELYALDGSDRSEKPYTVSEFRYGVREIEPPLDRSMRKAIFFSHETARRVTQWERGDDPLTRLNFTGLYDEYGQPQLQLDVAVTRGRDWRSDLNTDFDEPFLATRVLTQYAQPSDPDNHFIVDRIASLTRFQVVDNLRESAGNFWQRVLNNGEQLVPGTNLDPVVVGQTLNYYDDQLNVGEVMQRGALTRTEQLAFTEELVNAAYTERIPPYLTPGPTVWTSEYPVDFRSSVDKAGYIHHDGDAQCIGGFYVKSADNTYTSKGLVKSKRNPLNRQTDITYDIYELFPTIVEGPAIVQSGNVQFKTLADYDYQSLKPKTVTDLNDNVTRYDYTPLGFLRAIVLPGDNQRPSTQFSYSFRNFIDNDEPIYVHIKRFVNYGSSVISASRLNELIESREYSDGYGRVLQTRTQGENVRFGNTQFGGQVLEKNQSIGASNAIIEGTENNEPDFPNVIVSGWQIYDNKGQGIIKYEPYYSTGWSYNAPTGAEIGQRSTIYYDPLGRQQRLLNPDGSQESFVFGIPNALDNPEQFDPSPWESYSYDTNDNGGRTSTANNAINTPTTHHNTPNSSIIDALGRVVEQVERNGLDPGTEWHHKKTVYDIQGNALKIYDALGRLAFNFSYDLLKQKLRTELLDGGIRKSAFDAASNPIEFSDSKGALALRSFDELNRPTHLWAIDKQGELQNLRERIIYDGVGSSLSNPKSHNLYGKPYRHYDEAGLLQTESYDVKGNLLEKIRFVIRDEVIEAVFDSVASGPIPTYRVDWQPPGASNFADHAQTLLESKEYRTTKIYDALDRVTQIIYPEDVDNQRKVLLPVYNKAGTLESVSLDGDDYVKHIAYDAKGQRSFIAYGNGLITRYAYDLQTFRLVRMRTEKFQQLDSITFQTSGLPLQEYGYQYDLAGNIVSIKDMVKGCGFGATPDLLNRQFTYDPLYRLLSATGRECKSIAAPRPWEDLARCGHFPAALNQDNAPNETAAYTENYQYDAAGNMVRMAHDHHSGRWVRHFGMGGMSPQNWNNAWTTHLNHPDLWQNPNSNQLTHVGDDSPLVPQSHFYDLNGNMIQETISRHFEWDYADRMRAFSVRTSGAAPSVHAHYLYDFSGRRIKKYVHKSSMTEVSIYIDDIFVSQYIVATNIENNTIQIIDNQNRIATLRIGTAFTGDTTPRIKYVIADHLNNGSLTIDLNGNWINREEFTPYGETSYGGYAFKRYRLTSKIRDSETGFSYHGARYYSPHICKWTSVDPAGEIEGVNSYIYVGNNPVNLIDKSGYQPEPAPEEESLQMSISAGATSAPGSDAASTYPPGSRLPLEYTSNNLNPAVFNYGNNVSLSPETVPPEARQPLSADIPDEAFRHWAEQVHNTARWGTGTGNAIGCGTYTVDSLNYGGYLVGRLTQRMILPQDHGDEINGKAVLPLDENRLILDTLDQELYEGKPVAIGVDYHPGAENQSDGLSDHWFYITKRGYEADGTVYYIGMDNASSTGAGIKLYVNPQTKGLFKPGADITEPNLSTIDYEYRVTNVTPVR